MLFRSRELADDEEEVTLTNEQFDFVEAKKKYVKENIKGLPVSFCLINQVLGA